MRKAMRFGATLVVVLSLLVVAAGAAVHGEEMDAANVLRGVYGAIETKDIEAAMELVADNMVLAIIPPPPGMSGVFIGAEQNRAWFEALIADNGRAEFGDITVSGNGATWTAKCLAFLLTVASCCSRSVMPVKILTSISTPCGLFWIRVRQNRLPMNSHC